MINLRFTLRDGATVMIYDVYPASQEEPVVIPDDAVSVSVYMGIRP
jgi:hypothetical protein